MKIISYNVYLRKDTKCIASFGDQESAVSFAIKHADKGVFVSKEFFEVIFSILDKRVYEA